MYFSFILIYLVALILIGVVKTRKVKDASDFALAGRSLTPWVLVGTMIATWIGTGSILGNAGKTYNTGLAAIMIPLGSLLGVILLVFIAEKVRNMEITTVPEIIGNRFGDTSRNLVTIALVMAYMVIVSYQYNAGGSILQVVLVDEYNQPLISMETAVIISAIFIVAYTVLAGLFSVAYTDVANAVIIILTFIIALPLLWMKAGGLSGIESAFVTSGRASHMDFLGVFGPIDIINFCLPPFLLILGDANMYQRFSAGRSGAGVKKATIYFVFGVLIVETLIIATAWVSSAMIPDAENGRHVMIYAAKNILPPLLGATMITTIVGIIISTADSYLLVPATTIVHDVYRKYIHKTSDSKHILIVNRICVLLLGFIAFWVSKGFAKSEGFFERALYAYTIYGAGITPSLMAALFWKRATSTGVTASIVTGVVVTLLWKEWDWLTQVLPQSSFSFDEVLPAAFASTFVLITVSLLTQRKNAFKN
jgi:solute:Na+ symporter, SSS family